VRFFSEKAFVRFVASFNFVAKQQNFTPEKKKCWFVKNKVYRINVKIYTNICGISNKLVHKDGGKKKKKKLIWPIKLLECEP
jgi:hypothetical protein